MSDTLEKLICIDTHLIIFNIRYYHMEAKTQTPSKTSRVKKQRVKSAEFAAGPTNKQKFEELKTELSLVRSELNNIKAILALGNIQPLTNTTGLPLHNLERVYDTKLKAFQSWHAQQVSGK